VECIEGRATITSLGTVDTFVSERMDDIPPQPLPNLFQVSALVLNRLAVGRDPKVQSYTW
jgi:hypothetical protein